MAAEMVWRRYTDDAGNHYAIFVAEYWADKTYPITATVPFQPRNAADAILPRNVRPRYINLTDDTTGRHRRLNVGDVTSDWWTQVPTAYGVSLPDRSGASETYSATGRVGEKVRRGSH